MPNYLENEDFVKLILVYRKTKNPILYNEIGKRFLEIARNQLRLPCFINYSNDRKQEMISNAIFFMTKNLHDYDPLFAGGDITKSNPFSYFTTIARRAFWQTLAEYKKQDARTRPISYIDNVEDAVFRKSTTYKNRIETDIE